MKLLLLSLFVCLGAATAVAQNLEVETVLTRSRPDYDAAGIRMGRFRLFPELALDGAYDDNVLAGPGAASQPVPTPILDDTKFLIAPIAELQSDWSRHELNAGGRALLARYDELTTEDFTDYELWVDGLLDVGNGQLSGEAMSSRLHEPRTSPNEEGGVELTKFDLDSLGLGYRFGLNRFYADVSLDLAKITFDSTLRFSPDQGFFSTSNEDRDRTRTNGALRLGYRAGAGYSLFMEGLIYDIDFKILEADGTNRDSDGYAIVAGTELNFTDVTFGQIFVGYRQYDYTDPQFETQSGPTFGASVDWNVTRLTTLTFEASQDIFPTTIAGSSGIDTKELGFRVDHELRRNILLNLAIDYRNEDFQQTTRDDDVTGGEVGFVYLLNRYLDINGGYVYQNRKTNVDTGTQYRINQVFIGFRAKV